MNKKSTMPTIQNTLKFCLFLCDEQLEESSSEIVWTREVKAHQDNLTQLLKLMNESEETIMEMSKKSYEKAEKTFGKALAARLFANVKIVDGYVPPTDGKKLFEAIKAKGSASRTKEVKQPTGFFSESAGKAFEDALFHRNGTNGHKGMPVMATTFSELRQIEAQGELAQQFEMLCQNILQSSEYDPATKAQKLAALSAEYASLVSGQKGKK